MGMGVGGCGCGVGVGADLRPIMTHTMANVEFVSISPRAMVVGVQELDGLHRETDMHQ